MTDRLRDAAIRLLQEVSLHGEEDRFAADITLLARAALSEPSAETLPEPDIVANLRVAAGVNHLAADEIERLRATPSERIPDADRDDARDAARFRELLKPYDWRTIKEDSAQFKMWAVLSDPDSKPEQIVAAVDRAMANADAALDQAQRGEG